jgi:GNAT superfamily N-acetyltransferase
MRRLSLSKVIRPAQSSDKEAVVDLLSDAFAADPIVNWIVRADRKRSLGLRAFFRMWFELRSLRDGEVMTTDDHRGAMIWMPSNRVKVPLPDQIRQLPNFLRYSGWQRSLTLLRFFSAAEHAHPPEPHVYVQFIGLSRAARGSGLAFAFLQHAVTAADIRQVPLYAETSNPENLRTWARAGLHAAGEVDFGIRTPAVWKLLRPPKPYETGV